jgi:hypothetical protein
MINGKNRIKICDNFNEITNNEIIKIILKKTKIEDDWVKEKICIK